MKNKLITAFSGFFLAVMYTANGQTSMALWRSADDISSQTENVAKKDPGSIKHNECCQDVLKNFNGNAPNARWYISSFGLVIKFNVEGTDYRVDLDKKGNWLRTIRSYEERKLPLNIRSLINHSYNGYSISFVQEIEVPFQSLIFIVNLDGKDDIVQVRISGDEVEEFQKINKSHSDSFTSNNRN